MTTKKYSNVYIFWFCSILFFLMHPGYCQTIIPTGTPFVKQYKKDQYKAGNQNWSLAVDKDGRIYSANTEGLLQFDGQYWRIFPLPNHSTVRSVAIGKDGKIYTGGRGEFGYWTSKPFGNLTYHSLSKLVQDKTYFPNEEIWKIIVEGQRVFFHTFSKSYIWENNRIRQLTAKGEPFLFPHQLNNMLFFEQLPSGLHEFKQDKLIPVKGKDVLKDKNVLAILPFDATTSLIATSRNGLYLMKADGSILPWSVPANQLLSQSQINNGLYLYDGQYAFGTIQNGVIVINKNGQVIQHINKNNGLQNNTVLSIVKDNQKNIWVGLDNGIDRIEINSPLSFYTDFVGKIGTVYTSIIYQGKIYLGTNKGLFSSEWKGLTNYNSLNFSQIPNSNGQVWTLALFGDELICGHNDGTFKLVNGRLEKISQITGGWIFKPIFGTKNILQGNYTGLSKFSFDGIHLQFVQQFAGVKEPVRFLAQKDNHTFWIGDWGQIQLLGFDANFQQANILFSSKQDSIASKRQFTGIYTLENNLVFATDSGFLQFDNIVKRFSYADELNTALGTYKNSNKVIPINTNSYWFIQKTKIAKVDFDSKGKLHIDSNLLSPLQDRMMNNYENILPIENQYYLIGLDDGFAIYRHSDKSQKYRLPLPQIAQLINLTTGQAIIPDSAFKLSSSDNNLRISFSSPFYSSSPIQYQYYLEGYSDNWSEWSETAYQDFTNLPYGKFQIKIRAKDNMGLVSEIQAFSFTIRYPWYLSWWAKVFYTLVLITLIYLAYIFSLQRERKRQFQIRRKWLEEKKIALERETEQKEKDWIKLKNQQLEDQLQLKNKELANAALNIVYKNEMLNNLHDELKQLKDADGNKLSSDELKKINKLIDDAHNDDRDWHIFERSFNESHENFFKKLKQEFPDLVPNDLKLCAYLRLNMSSKEIASLLNISTRGVEIRRYRLRKKLGIPTDKNLSEFLMER
ncbi:helix-turn-helix and ligand-binding sensor domain-containing protein [Sphingobacterium paramultivorum]|uniref:helix-turn-helix and ligand-binding sensor domain-containing protein n=1 Tax=Sphingobacterium paramultivorum TaxID=2886510 RepID=UPI00129C5234|nr:triple tyrosine motif-containing protein [Sphingobacterium paramultivorum]